MTYRRDIEGLRALAILLVVAIHAGVPWLQGGFIGVDVFFVLSGYLITRLLTDELVQTGTIQFGRFYARRFRRLLPALLLMLGATAVLGWQLLPASRQAEQATTAMMASVWSSNFSFAFDRLDYFAPAASENLYLHTWSLGVEEQIYLVWPMILLFGFGAWRAKQQPSTFGVVQVLWIVAFVSFLACLGITQFEPHHAFYLALTRAWQFALGGLAGLAFFSRSSPMTAPLLWHKLIGFFGLIVIVGCAVWFGKGVQYPGAWAVLPSLGTTAILTCGAYAPNALTSRWLSTRPMVAIGRLSYSWYLWHWPVLLLGAELFQTPSGWLRFGFVGVSILLAWLSYHFVEVPIRRNPRLVQYPRHTILGALALMVCASSAALYWNSAAFHAMRTPAYQRTERIRSDVPSIYPLGCDQRFRSNALQPCEFGNANATRTVVILGDSVGLQWFPALAKVYDEKTWRIVVMTKSSCPMVNLPIFYTRIGRMYTECATWRASALQRIRDISPDQVVLGSSSTYDFSPQQWLTGSTHLLHEIAGSVGTIYILRATPVLPFDAPSCAEPRGKLWRLLTQASCTALARSPQNDAVFGALRTASSAFKNVKLIDLNDAVCPNGICFAEHNGILTYRDTQHLSASFVATLAPEMARQLNANGGTTPSVTTGSHK